MAPTTRKRNDVAMFALGALPAVLLMLGWYARNRGYPHFDEADYTDLAQRLAHNASAAFRMRLWKPVAHPLLLIPSLWVFGATNTRLAIAVTAGALLLALLAHVFLFARDRAGPVGAAVATAFIGTLPFVLGNAYHFNAEISAMAAGIAAAYWLTRVEGFTRPRPVVAAGLCVAAAACLRPFELAVVLAPWVWLAWPRPAWPRRRELVLFVALALAPPLLWYSIKFRELFEWAWACTFGELARLTGQRAGVSTPLFLGYLAKGLGGLPLAFLVAIAAGTRARPLAREPATRKLALATLAPLAFSVLFGAFTYSAIVRYYYPAALLAYLGLLCFLLTAPGARELRPKLVAAAAALQFVFAASLIAVRPGPVPAGALASGIAHASYFFQGVRSLLEPVRRDPTLGLYEALERETPRARAQLRPGELLALHHPSRERSAPWIADAWTLNLLAHERALPTVFLFAPGITGTQGPDILLILDDPESYWRRPGIDREHLRALSSIEIEAADGQRERYEVVALPRPGL